MFNARMKSDVLGVAVVLSADGSINGGTLGGTLLCPFEFCLLKQVVMSVMYSCYHHLKFLKRLNSSIKSMI